MRVRVVRPERCIGCFSCVFACSRELYGTTSASKTAVFVRASSVGNRFDVVICRACKDPPCARVCPEGALKVRQGGGILLDPSKCIGCGHCVEACDIGAIRLDPETSKAIICVYCGYCADFCPHGVIALEEVK